MNIERNEDFSDKFSFSYLNNAQENCNLDFFYTLDSIKRWFKEGLIPIFYSKWHGLSFEKARKEGYVEGIVFHHPDGRKAKLRYDMFEEFLSDRW